MEYINYTIQVNNTFIAGSRVVLFTELSFHDSMNRISILDEVM